MATYSFQSLQSAANAAVSKNPTMLVVIADITEENKLSQSDSNLANNFIYHLIANYFYLCVSH
jgi:hypothetical protein